MQNYEPLGLSRLDQLKGKPLASFFRRALAFVIDFFAPFLLFLFTVIYGAKLLTHLGLIRPDKNINLKFDFTNGLLVKVKQKNKN